MLQGSPFAVKEACLAGPVQADDAGPIIVVEIGVLGRRIRLLATVLGGRVIRHERGRRRSRLLGGSGGGAVGGRHCWGSGRARQLCQPPCTVPCRARLR